MTSAISTDNPFDELPEALVEEMLGQCGELGEKLSISFKNISEIKMTIREQLKKFNIIKRDTLLASAPSHPTSCGVDGAFAVERLLYTDMVAIAGVAVEGLTPPTEKRYWPTPHHLSKILTVNHNEATSLCARAVMICMELELAAKAPHDVVLMDGSLITPIIYLNQAISRINEIPKSLSAFFDSQLVPALESYVTIMRSERTDKIFASIPKYTTKREISKKLSIREEYEDRGLLTFVMEPGEFVGPIQLDQQQWHIPSYNRTDDLVNQVILAAQNLFIVYYRPYDHFPAIRIEISQSIATNPQRLAILLEAMRLQCSSPSIMEPYPLYLADRMVKHLGTALPAIRRATTHEMSQAWGGFSR